MTPRIVAAIDNVNMGLGHDGLTLIAKKFKIDLKTLVEGDLVLFLNRGKDKLKVLGPDSVVLGYIKMPKGRRIPLDAIQWLPKTFSSSGSINLEAAIEKSVKKAMESRQTKGLRAYTA